jgi:hypothetical protein
MFNPSDCNEAGAAYGRGFSLTHLATIRLSLVFATVAKMACLNGLFLKSATKNTYFMTTSR